MKSRETNKGVVAGNLKEEYEENVSFTALTNRSFLLDKNGETKNGVVLELGKRRREAGVLLMEKAEKRSQNGVASISSVAQKL